MPERAVTEATSPRAAVPPIAIVLGWVLLGETPPGLALVGGVMCLVGVYLVRRMPSGA